MSIGNLENMISEDPQLIKEYIDTMKMAEQDSEMEEFFKENQNEFNIDNDNDMFKRARVVMLSTNEKTNLALKSNKTLALSNYKYDNSPNFANKHLYIVSNDEIKEGDFGIITLESDKQLVKVLEIDTINNIYLIDLISLNNSKISVFKNEIKKIIATSDILPDYKAGIEVGLFLPKLSQAFIEKYVEQYNKSNIITDVLVEYKEIETCPNGIWKSAGTMELALIDDKNLKYPHREKLKIIVSL